MRQLLVAIVFLVHTVKPIAPFVEYAVNYDYIATVLCINKDKPQMHCNGKCHLTKMVAENSDTNSKKELPTTRLDSLLTPLCLQEIISIPRAHFFATPKHSIALLQPNSYAFTFSNHLLRPPIA
ncbi:hypothetical protein [Pustulibacterium marinum]|uniref:hypothetical protein n=1 Tax=Pustulibacterium marinum TaxID=1224947 RepID=UPI0015A57ED0|nr:hypothetical protein [Pustulibacterium marinum]